MDYIILKNNEKYTILQPKEHNPLVIIINTYESPFDYLPEVTNDLRELDYSGTIIFDRKYIYEFLCINNADERFVVSVFENGEFHKSSFRFSSAKSLEVALSL